MVVSSEAKRKILKLLKSGISKAQIGRECGVSIPTINQIAKQAEESKISEYTTQKAGNFY